MLFTALRICDGRILFHDLQLQPFMFRRSTAILGTSCRRAHQAPGIHQSEDSRSPYPRSDGQCLIRCQLLLSSQHQTAEAIFHLLQSPGTCPVKTRSAKYLQVRYLLILLVTLRAVQSVQVYKRLRVGLGHNGARSPFTSSVIAALHCQ
jgi:hypothetical protein